MSSSFYVILPSNTNIEGNRTNSFRVRLPRKLQFNSEWYVGLAVMVYPHSWPSLGTTFDQHVRVVWQTGESVKLSVPSASLKNPQELRQSLHNALSEGSETLAQKIRTVQFDYGKMVGEIRQRAKSEFEKLQTNIKQTDIGMQIEKQASAMPDIMSASDVEGAKRVMEEREKRMTSPHMPSENEIYLNMLNEEIAKLDDETRRILDSTKEGGFEAWVHAYRKARFACRFNFDVPTNRFWLFLEKKFIKQVELTEQLAYILGFDQQIITKTTFARFMPDMSGGVSCLHVYAPGLIEPMMVGDVTVPVLRIVTIRGQQDEIIEEQFFSIQYHKLLTKEISEIHIEIRTNSGVLMPFQYGTCTLTLHFKKASYF